MFSILQRIFLIVLEPLRHNNNNNTNNDYNYNYNYNYKYLYIQCIVLIPSPLALYSKKKYVYKNYNTVLKANLGVLY